MCAVGAVITVCMQLHGMSGSHQQTHHTNAESHTHTHTPECFQQGCLPPPSLLPEAATCQLCEPVQPCKQPH